MNKSKEIKNLLLRRYTLTFLLALISCAGTNYIHSVICNNGSQNLIQKEREYEVDKGDTVNVEALKGINRSIDLV